jgi:4-diphosphocytidyl-2-C-methyl-D-erythritol kinase
VDWYINNMYLFQTDKIWTVLAPAKLNLFFEVHGKRSDGFHEITSLAVPIRLFDVLRFEVLPFGRGVEFSCLGGGADVPQDSRNIVVRAIELFRNRFGIGEGIRVNLFKRIPSQAGLGGGSSDAVAALVAACKVWSKEISREELLSIATELGSDCPLFLQDGASIAYGRGERVESVLRMPKLHFVLFKPAEGLSTAEVYSKCMKVHDGNFHDVGEAAVSFETGEPVRISRRLFNRLEAPAAEIWTRFGEIKSRLERLDCLAVRMSGSGTAFYGLCHNAKHARHVAGRLKHGLEKNETVYNVES